MLTLVGWAAVAAAPAYSADRQQRFVIQHVTEAPIRQILVVDRQRGAPLPRAYDASGSWKRGKLPFSNGLRWIAAAPAAGDKAPGVQIVEVVRNGDERTLTIRLHANGNEHVELTAPEDARVRSAGAGGFVRRIDQNESGKYFVECFGRSCDGALLQLTIGQPKPVDFVLLGSRAALPAAAAPLLAARPRFARPQYARDESIAFTRVKL